jgi:hypothetical protein
LTDLVFVHEGNPDFLPNTKLINATKLRYTAGILYSLEQMKAQTHNFTALPVVQAYLLSPETMDEDELKNRSLALEPRRKVR